tara:strand:- start:28474 stop:28653 length:180 start_codon:yes stop_codon:yes gene_type:complete
VTYGEFKSIKRIKIPMDVKIAPVKIVAICKFKADISSEEKANNPPPKKHPVPISLNKIQ